MVGNIDGGRKVEVLCRDKGADQFAARLRKVAKDRRKWARDNDISCYRVYDADLPDFAVAIDRYDGVWKSEGESCLVIAEYQAPKSIDAAKAAARLDDAVEIASATLRHSSRARVLEDTPSRKRRRAIYRPAKRGHVLYTQESGNVFECDLGSYLDTGIFLDHRVTREMVGSMAEGKSFLNLFSYTGTCTVSCGGGRCKIDAYGRFIADLFVVGASQYGIERLRWPRARLRAPMCCSGLNVRRAGGAASI